MFKIWSEWNVARLVLPVSAIVVLFWTAGLWTGYRLIVPYLITMGRLHVVKSISLYRLHSKRVAKLHISLQEYGSLWYYLLFDASAYIFSF